LHVDKYSKGFKTNDGSSLRLQYQNEVIITLGAVAQESKRRIHLGATTSQGECKPKTS